MSHHGVPHGRASGERGKRRDGPIVSAHACMHVVETSWVARLSPILDQTCEVLSGCSEKFPFMGDGFHDQPEVYFKEVPANRTVSHVRESRVAAMRLAWCEKKSRVGSVGAEKCLMEFSCCMRFFN